MPDTLRTVNPLPLERGTPPVPSGMTIGHVHLRVSDLARSEVFYREVLGLDVVARMGNRAAFLSVDGYHHHLGLNTWESAGAPPAERNRPGLYHVAFLYPDRKALAVAVARVLTAGVPLTGMADHGVSEALYLDDPDGNGIELYRDRPRGEWPLDARGHLLMSNDPFDLPALLAEA